MIAINLRGTSGAGKSHLARRIIEHYPKRPINLMQGRRTPISYVCHQFDTQKTPLFVLGHYEADQGGGADTVSRADGFRLLNEAADTRTSNLLWEGVIFSDEVPYTIE